MDNKYKSVNLSYQGHPFHTVNPSFWPLLGAMAGFTFTFGMVMWMHDYVGGGFVLFFGVISVLVTMWVWWGDVIDESLQGCHTIAVQNGLRIGIVLFIISEAFFFLAFFWGFFHSALAPTIEIGAEWPPAAWEPFHPFEVPLVNTLILLLSGVTITWSHHALVSNAHEEAMAGLFMTILLAILFTAIQVKEYLEATWTLSCGIYGTMFFSTTGLHGLHVIIGTIFLIVCFFRMKLGHFTSSHHVGYEGAIWYWHFVDAVWLFLWTFVYFWGNDVDGSLHQGIFFFMDL